MIKKPVVLVVVDGLGLQDNTKGNAFANAKTPRLDELKEKFAYTTIKAAGEAVGLPEGQMGNSEVGHLNIGAGEVVYTGLSLIQKAIDDGSFFENEALLKSIKHAKDNNSTLHVMGLLSPGGVHSVDTHLYKTLELAKKEGLTDVTVHAFGDGRDVAPQSIKPWLFDLSEMVAKFGYHIGSIQGRLYAMDRDENFDKIEQAFETIKGNSDLTFNPAQIGDFIDAQYEKGHTDEFIEPAISNDPAAKFLKENDAVIFFNFRPDRARQLSHMLVGSDVYKVEPASPVKGLQLTTMMKYDGIDKADVAFESMFVANPIGKVMSDNGVKSLRAAETQKYAHVTFFMDGGIDIEYPHTDRILVPSVKVDNFADAPKMSAKGITDEVIKKLPEVEFVIMNYANPDMVGHTGNYEAAVIAVEELDTQIGRLYDAITIEGGTLFITADHGNCEIMEDANGKPVTKHSTSDVPFYFTETSLGLKSGGKLANVAPTILDYMGIEKPESMNEESLLDRK